MTNSLPSQPSTVQSVVDALHKRGWVLEIAYPERQGDSTVITPIGLPKRYIDISDDEVVSLNIDEEGIGNDITIRSLASSADDRERADQIAEISTWFGL